MQAPSGQAGIQAAGMRPPLEAMLAHYPRQNAPGITNASTRWLASVAKRANGTAQRGSLLRDYLATV